MPSLYEFRRVMTEGGPVYDEMGQPTPVKDMLLGLQVNGWEAWQATDESIVFRRELTKSS